MLFTCCDAAMPNNEHAVMNVRMQMRGEAQLNTTDCSISDFCPEPKTLHGDVALRLIAVHVCDTRTCAVPWLVRGHPRRTNDACTLLLIVGDDRFSARRARSALHCAMPRRTAGGSERDSLWTVVAGTAQRTKSSHTHVNSRAHRMQSTFVSAQCVPMQTCMRACACCPFF